MTSPPPPTSDEDVPILGPGDELVPGYLVVEHLRRGHRLDVYDAWSTHRQAGCVVKLVRPDRVRERHTAILLEREGRLLRDLTHPHLVRAYEVVDQPHVAVVMETLTGPTLSDLLAKHDRLKPREAALLGTQIGSGLRFLHLHGYIHGDVTPGNIVLENGVPKLIDLSLSGPPGPVRAGSGTRGYRAPEQNQGTTQTEATDVWGLGAVLHHARTGRAHDDHANRFFRVRARSRISEYRHDQRSLAEVITQCLHPNPEDRCSLASAREALARIAGPHL